MNLQTTLAAWAPRWLSITRAMSGLLYMQHGLQKWFHFPPAPLRPGAPPPSTPDLFTLFGFGGALELVGGALLVIGLCTRGVGFVLSGMMAVAYFMAHAPRSFYPIVNGGDLAILFCFVFLYFFFAGGGPWSVDAMLARRKTEKAAG